MTPLRKLWITGLGIAGLALGLAALALFSAHTRPDPAHPALWQVEGPGGQSAYLFGTIHTLPRPAAWRGPAVEQALANSDRIIVEIAQLNDSARVFQSLAHTANLPPLDQRVRPDQRARLAAALAAIHRQPGDFTDTETWAAALMLAHDDGDPAHGVDRALLADPAGKPIEEFEGAARQLALFDRLPETAQRRLLADAIAGEQTSPQALAQAWRDGDITTIARETSQGLLADPTLREALYTGRNRAWAAQLIATMARGGHPFVAVGTAHLAGPDGLPVLLAARGYRVRRLQ